jgi:hypothetical protein
MPAGTLPCLVHDQGPGSSPIPARPPCQHKQGPETRGRAEGARRTQGVPRRPPPPLPCLHARCACGLAPCTRLEHGYSIAGCWGGQWQRRPLRTPAKTPEKVLTNILSGPSPSTRFHLQGLDRRLPRACWGMLSPTMLLRCRILPPDPRRPRAPPGPRRGLGGPVRVPGVA